MFKRFKRWVTTKTVYGDWFDTPCEHGLDCGDILVVSKNHPPYSYSYPACYKRVTRKDAVYQEHEGYVRISYRPLFECNICEERFHGPEIDCKFES